MGDYLTIGDNVVVQLDHMSGDRCKIVIQAPKEVPVLRGEVLERTEKRPECVIDRPRLRKKEFMWNQSKAQALKAMRKLLYQLDGKDENIKTLKRQLNHIFPEVKEADVGLCPNPPGALPRDPTAF